MLSAARGLRFALPALLAPAVCVKHAPYMQCIRLPLCRRRSVLHSAYTRWQLPGRLALSSPHGLRLPPVGISNVFESGFSDVTDSSAATRFLSKCTLLLQHRQLLSRQQS